MTKTISSAIVDFLASAARTVPLRVASTDSIEPGFDPIDRPGEPRANPVR
jgi:hypothetical protein